MDLFPVLTLARSSPQACSLLRNRRTVMSPRNIRAASSWVIRFAVVFAVMMPFILPSTLLYGRIYVKSQSSVGDAGRVS